MDSVARQLVVEDESTAFEADLAQPTFVLDQGGRNRSGVATEVRDRVRGLREVLREDMLDVHQQKLLVLLLVVETELQQARDGGLGISGDELQHRFIDTCPVTPDFGCTRARQDPSRGPGMSCPERLVIRVEQVGVVRVERRETRQRGLAQESVEDQT